MAAVVFVDWLFFGAHDVDVVIPILSACGGRWHVALFGLGLDSMSWIKR